MNNREIQKQDLLGYIRQFGRGSLAYSALQDGLNEFVKDGCGFIAHAPVSKRQGTTLCLADPVCSADSKKELLQDFVQTFKDPVFVHVSRDTAETLHSMGFFINEMGTETIVNVQEFSLKGSKKEFLRSQRNRALRDDVKVVEVTNGEVSPGTMRAISEAWMKNKAVNKGELSFIARPAIYEEEPDVRRFFAVKNDKVIGFVFFDPMYEDGKVIGYLANFLRTCVEVSYSVCDFIIVEAIAKFKSEGKRFLSLGFSPFAEVNDCGEFRFSKVLREVFKYSFENANYLYAFKQLSFHKQRYRPGLEGTEEVKVYCASRSSLPLRSLYACVRKMGIRPVAQTAHHLVDVTKQRLTIPSMPTSLSKGAMAMRAAAASLLVLLGSQPSPASAREVERTAQTGSYARATTPKTTSEFTIPQ
jgi:phosphatidylglycerol lysyltransferase